MDVYHTSDQIKMKVYDGHDDDEKRKKNSIFFSSDDNVNHKKRGEIKRVTGLIMSDHNLN